MRHHNSYNFHFLIVLFVAVVLQIIFSDYLKINNNCVDFYLIATVYAGAFMSKTEGMFMGLLCGIIADQSTCTLLGTNVFSKIPIGFLAGFISEKLFCGVFLTRIILIGCLSILDGILIWFILKLSEFDFTFWNNLVNIIVPQTLLNIVIGSIFMTLISKIKQRKDSNAGFIINTQI